MTPEEIYDQITAPRERGSGYGKLGDGKILRWVRDNPEKVLWIIAQVIAVVPKGSEPAEEPGE